MHLPNVSVGPGCNKGQFNWFEFRVSYSHTGCSTSVKKHSLFLYLPIFGAGKVGFILFSRVVALCEMQTAPFRF